MKKSIASPAHLIPSPFFSLFVSFLYVFKSFSFSFSSSRSVRHLLNESHKISFKEFCRKLIDWQGLILLLAGVPLLRRNRWFWLAVAASAAQHTGSTCPHQWPDHRKSRRSAKGQRTFLFVVVVPGWLAVCEIPF